MSADAIAAVYLFVGGDVFLKQQELDRIKNAIFRDAPGAPDYTVFYGSRDRVQEIVETARTLPFGSGQRLVVVKEADRLPSSDKEALIRYCLRPSGRSCVVIESEEASPREIFRSSLSGKARAVFCQPPTGDRPERIIRKMARDSGKTISPEAVALIKEKAGGDAGVIAGAVEKVILYVGEGQEISAVDAAKLTGRSIENSVFDLLRAIESGKIPAALAVLKDLRNDKVEPPEILGVLGWQFRRLKKISSLLARGLSDPEIAREAGIKNQFILAKTIRLAEKSRPETHDSRLRDIMETDVALKSGRMKPRTGMELLVMKLCRN